MLNFILNSWSINCLLVFFSHYDRCNVAFQTLEALHSAFSTSKNCMSWYGQMRLMIKCDIGVAVRGTHLFCTAIIVVHLCERRNGVFVSVYVHVCAIASMIKCKGSCT